MALPENVIEQARRAIYRPGLTAEEERDALFLLGLSPHPIDQAIVKHYPKHLRLQPDMAQIQPPDPFQVLVPGGQLGWVASLAIAFVILALLTFAAGMWLAPHSTLSFFSLGYLP